jgi:23S rRNA (uracil1939-C5)-methyltransferase
VVTGPPRSADRWTSADLVKVVKAGPDRVLPPCPAFTRGCGGCQWLHLAYSAQLSWKEKTLAGLLRSRAGYAGKINPIVPMAHPEAYRNKLSLKNSGGSLVFVPEFDEASLAPVHCMVQTPALQRAWGSLKTHPVPPSIEQVHLRSNGLGQVGLHAFVKEGSAGLEPALLSLLAACPGAIGLGATGRKGYRHVAGERVLPQSVADTIWLIPHNGFFQTNQTQAGALLDLVRREAKVTKTDRVLDLYCGAGFFGLALAAEAREVTGIEENPQSVESAQASARRSGIANATFEAGDLGDVLARIDKAPGEIAVVDPPREGLLPRAREAIVARSPRRIVYISCYPPSLVRDYKSLSASGWRGISCTPVDMFPHTSHVEIVLTLERA